MSSESPIPDVVEGVTKGVLDWTAEKISDFVTKLKNKKLAFIQEPKTIEVVREQYNSGEAKFYQNYIKDKQLLFYVKLGLTLRKLENDEDRLRNLREKIFRKYGLNVLHIAEFVQNGILNRYVGILLEELTSIAKLEKDISETLSNIEKHTFFVQANHKKSDLLKKATIMISANSPSILIISGVKSAAKLISDNIEQLKEIMKDYEFERFAGGEKETLFFKRKGP